MTCGHHYVEDTDGLQYCDRCGYCPRLDLGTEDEDDE